MKTTLTLLSALLFTNIAHADFSSDKEGKSVRCTGDQFVVIVDKARTQIKVVNAIDPGHPEEYDIVDRQSDGDTFVSYIARGNDIAISFDDQGDTLSYSGQAPLKINCAK